MTQFGSIMWQMDIVRNAYELETNPRFLSLLVLTGVSIQDFYDRIWFFEHNFCKNKKIFTCNTSIDSACFS